VTVHSITSSASNLMAARLTGLAPTARIKTMAITVTFKTQEAATAFNSEVDGIWTNKREDNEYPVMDLWTDFADAVAAGLDNGRLSFQLDGRFLQCLADTRGFQGQATDYENLLSNKDEDCGEGDLKVELDARSKGFVAQAARTNPAERTPDQKWWLDFANNNYVA
jgi:hypothetical protein